jgi:hypothetical protein
MPVQAMKENLEVLDKFVAANLEKMNPIELMAKQYMTDITIHPCVDGNGRSALLSMFPIANKFGLPVPLVTDLGTCIFHPQNGQATKECSAHPADAMAAVAQGMRLYLELRERVFKELDQPVLCAKCKDLAWMRIKHKCGFDEPRCPAHTTKATCEKCDLPGLEKKFLS